MSFNGTEGAPISSTEATAATKKWAEDYSTQPTSSYYESENIESLLEPDTAMGIRIYWGLDSEMKMSPVLCAANAQEQDMLQLLIDESGAISVSSASIITKRWRDNNKGQSIANFFGKDILWQLLNLSGCVGIRLHYGLDSTGMMKPILCGVDGQGKDIPQLSANFSYPCPPRCAAANPLNS